MIEDDSSIFEKSKPHCLKQNIESTDTVLLENSQPFTDTLRCLHIHQVDPERFPFMKDLYARKQCLFLTYKVRRREREREMRKLPGRFVKPMSAQSH